MKSSRRGPLFSVSKSSKFEVSSSLSMVGTYGGTAITRTKTIITS